LAYNALSFLTNFTTGSEETKLPRWSPQVLFQKINHIMDISHDINLISESFPTSQGDMNLGRNDDPYLPIEAWHVKFLLIFTRQEAT
jgi:hypothetical protein